MTDVLRNRIVLLYELIDGHETSADAKNQIVVLNFHNDLLGEVVVVAAAAFTHKEALHPLLGVCLVYEFGQFGVDGVIFLADVLKVNLVELVPVLYHFLKLGVAVAEGFHLLQICLQGNPAF